MSEQRAIEVNWVQAIAGALAAMSSAVLLSTVGVTGTIIGAAVGSVLATVGSAIYSHYLSVSRQRVAAARAMAFERASRARARGRWAPTPSAESGSTPAPDPRGSVRWREAVRGLAWKRIALASVGVFVLVMGTIVAFELAAGRSVSSFTGGSHADGPRTSLDVGGGPGSGDQLPADAPEQDPDSEPADGAEQTPPEESTEPPTDDAPTEETPTEAPETGAPPASTAPLPSEQAPAPTQ